MSSRGNHVRTLAVLLVAVAVLAGTGVVLMLPLPETRSVSSADGAVRIDGAWSPSGSPPSIIRQSQTEENAVVLRGPAYAISAPRATDGSPYRLVFTIPSNLGTATPVLYRFAPDLDAWRAYPSVRDAQSWLVTTQASQLAPALWGIGVASSSQRPDRAGDALGTLLAAPPPGAVGYEVYDALANAFGDAVLLSDPLDAGGCSGVFRLGSSQTKSSRDLSFGDGTYRVIVRWYLGNGCQPGEQMMSSRIGS